MAAWFIDTNAPIYAAGVTHRYRQPCIDLLARIASGSILAITSAGVHQEIINLYLCRGRPDRAQQVSVWFQALVPGVLSVHLADIAMARELALRYPSLNARDLLHSAVMLNNGLDMIVSADQHFDTVSEIHRLDPVDI